MAKLHNLFGLQKKEPRFADFNQAFLIKMIKKNLKASRFVSKFFLLYLYNYKVIWGNIKHFVKHAL